MPLLILFGQSVCVSNVTGYLVQEAYSLDFIPLQQIPLVRICRPLAGEVNDFQIEGFYVGFLFTLDFVFGVYVTHTDR